MPAAKDKSAPFSAAVCAALRKIRANRITAKSKLEDAVTYRKELDEQIDSMGKDKSKERLEADHELVNCLREIDYQRARIKALGDKLESVIEDADQGKLDFGDDDIQTDFSRAQIKSLWAEKEAEKAAPKVVPCVGGTYTFKHPKHGAMSGCVKGGGPRACRVEVDECGSWNDDKVARGDVIEIAWPEYTITEIDVPKDGIAVDQQGMPSAATEMGNGKKK